MRADQRRRRNGEFSNEDLYRFMTLQECGDPTAELEQAVREGWLVEVDPGWYRFPDAAPNDGLPRTDET